MEQLIPINVRLPKELRDWLRDYCRREGRLVQYVIREALESYRRGRSKRTK